ncbi:MAG: glycosyltransferase family 9 protein [Planctomycetota bacterium]|nr:glycosyltransferase family 9 protein [Planctomycetota bacterium]MDE2216858.1 glycosyltransferase family 9 protein [Planctomycetota bacterium]
MEEKTLNYKPANSNASTSCSNIKSSVKRILIIRPGAIGDLIVTLPTIGAIRSHFKSAKIEVMGYPLYLEIIRGHFYADTVSRFDQADVAQLFTKDAKMFTALMKRLGDMDLIISFVSDKERIFTNNLKTAGARHVVHYEPFPSDREGIHIIDYFLKFLNSLGISHLSKIPKLYLRCEDERFGDDFIKNRIADPKKILVAVHPGSGSRQKCWHTERFAALTNWLIKEMDAQVLVVSGPADGEIISRLKMEVKIEADLIVLDQISLPNLAAVIKRCKLFIGNDSGITHLAAAVGTPTVSIFGPTDPNMWGTRGGQVKILYNKIPCSPCSLETRKNCAAQICLESIKVEDVVREVRNISK